MGTKHDLFDLMQDFEPPENLLCDDCEKADIERCKLRVFRKKGAGFMRRKVLKRLAAAALALVVLMGGTAGVDAATGGHLRKKIIEKITIQNPDGSLNEQDGVEIKENKDGSLSVHIDGEKYKDDEYTLEFEDAEDGVKIKEELEGKLETK